LADFLPGKLRQVDRFQAPVIPEAFLERQEDAPDGRKRRAGAQGFAQRLFHAHRIFHKTALLRRRHPNRRLDDRADLRREVVLLGRVKALQVGVQHLCALCQLVLHALLAAFKEQRRSLADMLIFS